MKRARAQVGGDAPGAAQLRSFELTGFTVPSMTNIYPNAMLSSGLLRDPLEENITLIRSKT